MIVKFEDMEDDKKYQLLIICSDCQEILNKSVVLTGKEVRRRWAMLIMGSPLNTGSCPKGCPPTYSDCNIHTDIEIHELTEEEARKEEERISNV